MASTLPPVRGAAFSFAISLVSQADTDTFQDNPTLAAGDVKIVKDGTLDDNIDSLPTAVTSLTRVLNVALSATEMTADRVDVLFHDAAGSEWQDHLVSIYTAAQTLDTTDSVADTVSGIVGHTDYGNAKLVRATTPANTLDVAATGEASANVTLWKGATAPDAPPSKAQLDAGFLAQAGADGDTLKTLSDQIDGLPTNAEFEARTLVAADYVVVGDPMTIARRP